MSLKDKVVNLIIRGRDLLSQPLKKGADATEDAARQIDKINDSLKTLTDQANKVAKAQALEMFGDELKEKMAAAQQVLADTREEMARLTQPSEALTQSFNEAVAATQRLQAEQQRVSSELHKVQRSLQDAGVNTASLGQEQAKLAGRARELGGELKTLERAQKAALQTGELRTRTQVAQQEFERTRQRVTELAKAMDATKKPSQQLRTEFGLAKSEANRAATAYQKVSRELEEHEAVLREAGVQTQDLGAAERKLAQDIGALQVELQQINRTQKDISSARSLTPYFEDLSQGVAESERHLAELTQELNRVQAPSRALNKQLGEAAKQAGRAQIAYERNQAALAQLKDELDAAGIDSSELVRAQQRLAESMVTVRQRIAAKKRELAGMRDTLNQAKTGVEQFNSAVGETTRRLLGWAAAYVGLEKIKQGLMGIIGTGGQFETLREQLIGVYGDVARGEQAFEWAVRLNERLPTSLQDVLQAFVMLKNNGMEPMDGTLEKLINANARYGRGTETLIPIIRQLTQSWGKNRLQAEEAYVLIENGLPVWNLLAEATGRNVAELQKMSEQGRLTRGYLQDLIDTMGKAGAGVVERRMKTWEVMLAKMRDRIQQIQDQIAQSGALDYFKQQLDAVLRTTKEMAEDGRLKAFAKEFSDGMVTAARAAKDMLTWVWQNREALTDLAKVAVGLKLASIFLGLAQHAGKSIIVIRAVTGAFVALQATATGALALIVAGLARMRNGLSAAIVLAGRLRLALLATPVGVLTALGLAVWELGKRTAEWAEQQQRGSKVSREHNQVMEQQAKDMAELSDRLGITITSWAEYIKLLDEGKLKYDDIADELVTTEELLRRQKLRTGELGDELRQRLLPVLGDMITQLEQMGQGQYSLDQLKQLNETVPIFELLAQATGRTRGQLEQMAEAGEINRAMLDQLTVSITNMVSRGEQVGTVMTPAMEKMIEVLERAKSEGKGAEQAIKQLFGELKPGDSGDFAKVRELSVVLDEARQKAIFTRDEIKQGLRKQLADMAGSDLRNLQVNWIAAFGESAKYADLLSDQMDASLAAAFDKLGGSLAVVRETLTEAGKDAVQTFLAVSENAGASGAEVLKAFDLGLAMAQTKGDVDALTTAVQQWGKANGIAGDEIDQALRKAQARLTEVNRAYQELGITSAKTLQQTAEDARRAYDQIVAMNAPLHDVKQGFLAYASAELAAAAANNRHADATLRSRAATLGLSAELESLIHRQHELSGATDKATLSSKAHADQLRKEAEAAREAAAAKKEDAQKEEKSSQRRMQTAASVQQLTEAWKGGAAAASMSIDDLNQKVKENQDALARYQMLGDGPMGAYRFIREQNVPALEQANKELREMIQGKQLVQDLTAATQNASEAMAEYAQRTGTANDMLERHRAGAGRAAKNLAELITGAERAQAGMQGLDSATLSQLQSAIDSAKNKLRALEDSARSTLRSLQDELDQLYGNTEAVERRRYETQLAQLKAQLAEAEAAGNAEASNQLRESIRIAETLHREKMKAIQVEKAEQAKQEQQARQQERQRVGQPAPGAAGEVTTLRLEAPDGSSSELKGSPDDVNATLAALKQAGLVVRKF